jgi:hypothetical protein
MREARQNACTAAGSIGRGRRHRGNAAAHPKPRHTRPTHRRWQRGHTESIVVIAAVFQAPTFALNADAKQKACKPSRALSKSLLTIECAKYAPEMSEARKNERSTAEACMLRRLGLAQTQRNLP